jgi:hypothetical protein
MNTIEHYQGEGSAEHRLWIWQVSLQIAAERPLVGGGFRITHWSNETNRLLAHSSLQRMTTGLAAHSIYFDVLSEHGWVGLILFLMIGGYFMGELLLADKAISPLPGTRLGKYSRKNGAGRARRLLGRGRLSIARLFG